MAFVRLATLSEAQLEAWMVQAQAYTHQGQLATYIPLLASANPDSFGVQVQCQNGQIYACGAVTSFFPLMSVIKPFVLLYLLEELGSSAVFAKVGMEPSDQPFNSLAQLEADQGWPRNPLINSGAILLASLLPGKDGPSRADNLRQWLNAHAGCSLVLAQSMLASVRAAGGRHNWALADWLERCGRLEMSESAIDTYNHVCCLSGTVADLARLGLLLAHPQGQIRLHHCRTVNAIMTTCGLYQASGRCAVQIGLPTKSGISGALLSVVPQQGAIACYGPALDRAGNSLAGLLLLEQLTQALDLSIFGRLC